MTTPKSSGARDAKDRNAEVRIAVISLSAIKRPIASSGQQRCNGKAIGMACGMRNTTNFATRTMGACWLMM